MPAPGPNTHRRNRRNLGRGTYPRPAPITVTVTHTTSTAMLVFSQPVQVKGLIDLTIPGRTAITQAIATTQNITIEYNANLNALSWSLPTPPQNVTSSTGAPIIGCTGTFGGIMPIAINDVLVADGAGGQLGGRGVILGDGSVSLATNNFTIDTDGNVAAASFAGDGSLLTGIDFAQITGTPPNPFDQSLNTADTPTFATVTADLIGNGSQITGLDFAQLSGTVPNPFNQSLDTTDSPTFYNLNVGHTNVLYGTIVFAGGADGTVPLTIKPPSAGDIAWASYTLTLPAGPGNAGQVLTAEGTGRWLWSDALITLASNVATLSAAVDTNTSDIATLQGQVAAILAQLATGVTGDLTPGVGNLHADNGIVTAID